MIHIRKAGPADLSTVASLTVQLWPDHDLSELESEIAPLLSNPQAAVFLADSGDEAVGFAQCGLRHDYVEGTDSSPVGYLEGIYIVQAHRRSGIARMLLDACENWAKGQGCTEFASDCELANRESLAFHLNVGFEEANRIICFRKNI